MFNRRSFLSRSALLSLSPLVPSFLSRSLANESAKRDDRILVVLQLDGGNDGLNTVIPFADENYARFRPQLRIPTADALKLNSDVGLHPAMRSVNAMASEGRFTILQGVGYPNPDRSHFRSMAIWHQGCLDAEANSGFGWLGNALDHSQANRSTSAEAVSVGNQTPPLAMLGRHTQVVSLNRESDLLLPAGFQSYSSATTSGSELNNYVQHVLDHSYQTSRQLSASAQANAKGMPSSYPDTELARQLSLVSLLIKTEAAARVYYISQPGYDTHVGQPATHARLLQTFSDAVKSFFDDLAASKLQDRVTLLAFSEFGRRVEENDGIGTDHGAAGPVFLAGPATVGGIVGRHPSLTDLDDGDLKMSLDFRAIYARVLKDWLQISVGSTTTVDLPCPPLFLA